jgi:hypothetical protein
MTWFWPAADRLLDATVVAATRASCDQRHLGRHVREADAVDDLRSEPGDYDGAAVYARTKRAEVIFTELWAERLAGTGIFVHSMHPGWADTPGLASSLPGFHRLAKPLLRTPEQGADTIVFLGAAGEPARSSGLLWHDRRPRPTHRVAWTPRDAPGARPPVGRVRGARRSRARPAARRLRARAGSPAHNPAESGSCLPLPRPSGLVTGFASHGRRSHAGGTCAAAGCRPSEAVTSPKGEAGRAGPAGMRRTCGRGQ